MMIEKFCPHAERLGISAQAADGDVMAALQEVVDHSIRNGVIPPERRDHAVGWCFGWLTTLDPLYYSRFACTSKLSGPSRPTRTRVPVRRWPMLNYNGHHDHRWSHVPLAELFREAGLEVRPKKDGKVQAPHSFRHDTKSGFPLVIWEDNRWWCSSCFASGDAADFLVEAGKAADRAEAERILLERYGPPHSAAPKRTTIQVNNRFPRDIAADAIEALGKSNNPPRLFGQGTELVRLAETGLAADTINAPALKGILDRCADFVKAKKGEVGEDDVLVPARPPDDVVKDILSQQRLPFPALKGFASTPVFLPGGRLLACDGYDPGSGIYMSLEGLQDLRWDMPLEEAKNLLLNELLVDFPFVDEASKAHALAALLFPFLRQMITGPTPIHLVDAPARGTGKGLLADLIAIVTTGTPAYVMALPRDDDEVDKRITATLLASHQLVLLDNVTVLRSAALSAALTTTLWRGRVLGKSEMVDAPNTGTWLATGNNVELSDEVNRRTVLVRLDAQIESPEERTGFKHPLPGWAIQHRSELVSACLSIINRWIQEGMPWGQATLGRFEDWAGIMSGVLSILDVSGFLQNREQQKSRDSESGEWAALCAAWWTQYGE
jgi:hypothetical protein